MEASEDEHTPEMSAINEAIDAAIENPEKVVRADNTEDTTKEETDSSKEGETVVEKQEMMLDELPVVDNSDGPNLEIPQIEDVDYEKRTEEINNKIKADYDAFLDSAFSDDTETIEEKANEEEAK